MSEQSSHRVPDSLNYKTQSIAYPYYKFSKVVPLSGSQQVILPVSSTAETLMEIPTNVINLAESYLFADVQYVTQGAGNWSWIYLDGMPLIQQVQLYTRSGIYLCDIPQFQNYMKLVRKINTKKDEYLSNDPSSFLYPSNSLVSDPPAVTPSNGVASQNYVESAYVASNANYGLGANTNIDFTLQMKLGAIKKSIFAMNKDVVFPDILVLRILWGPASKAFYLGTSGINPQTGQAICVGTGASTAPAPTGVTCAIIVYNLCLMLCVEKNEDLSASVRALVNSPQGLNLLIDYPYCYKQNLSGSNQNISIRANRGHGKCLLDIVTAPFANNEFGNTAYDNSNVANASTAVQTAVGSKVQQYYTQLDNVRLQDITLICGNQYQDDYRENKKHMKDTPYSNMAIYQNNWFHLDRFYQDEHKHIADENLDRGMSLIVERKYDFIGQQTTNANYNWYTFMICSKDLHIGSNMIQYQ